jgi:hypothetical protein
LEHSTKEDVVMKNPVYYTGSAGGRLVRVRPAQSEHIRECVLAAIAAARPYPVAESLILNALRRMPIQCSETELRRELDYLDDEGLIHLDRLEGAPWLARIAEMNPIANAGTLYGGSVGGKLVRFRTPVVTPEEMLAEVEPATPATTAAALQTAAIALREDLKQDLRGFRYREQLASPRAIWARVHAVALASVLSAMRANGIGEL